MNELQLHPLCSLFPRMVGSEFEALKADIRVNGLRQPIVLQDGMILDGGNRYRACIEGGVKPWSVEHDGSNLVAYVLSANLHRRHMTVGQHAAIVASATDWGKAHAQGRSVNQSGNPAGLMQVVDRTALSGASDRTQRDADKVARADPELAKKVGHGEVSLATAVEQVSKPKKARKPPKKKRLKPTAAKTVQQIEAEENAQIAYGDFDPIAALEEANREIASLTALLKAAEADDQKAEALKWRKAYDHAVREQSAAMDRVVKGLEHEKWAVRQLHRCGKAVGETDPDKMAAAVEGFVRRFKAAA